MKEYGYYPGCSLKGSSKAYENSLIEVFKVLGITLKELEDWNCCGATAYFGVDKDMAVAVSGRNLAIAEKSGFKKIVAPCAGCYLTLKKSNIFLKEDQSGKIKNVMAKAGLNYNGTVEVIHPLEIFFSEIKPSEIAKNVKVPLKGWKVASYYGCQIVRPYKEFDDPYDPQSLDLLMMALQAETVDYPYKTRCCGGSLTGTVEEVGLRLVYILLKEIKKRGANAIVTACPLCHFNLDVYQKKVSSKYGEKLDIPVIHFTQLIGYAFGIDKKKLGFESLMIYPKQLRA
ncbi:MAG: CoB--CoM heterodisulfide reductase iron-sulfur subunit B family protein [Candidatus Aminicenantia bacterium]